MSGCGPGIFGVRSSPGARYYLAPWHPSPPLGGTKEVVSIDRWSPEQAISELHGVDGLGFWGHCVRYSAMRSQPNLEGLTWILQVLLLHQ